MIGAVTFHTCRDRARDIVGQSCVAASVALFPYVCVLQGVTAKVQEDEGRSDHRANQRTVSYTSHKRPVFVVLSLWEGVKHKKVDQDHHGDGDAQTDPMTSHAGSAGDGSGNETDHQRRPTSRADEGGDAEH